MKIEVERIYSEEKDEWGNNPLESIKVFVDGIEANYWRKSCRHIYRANNILIKIDTGEDDPLDMEQCQNEINTLKSINDRDLKYFQPIIAYGHGWVAQEFVEFDESLREEYWRVIYNICEKYGFTDIYIGNNWGVRKSDNQPVIYDFGY